MKVYKKTSVLLFTVFLCIPYSNLSAQCITLGQSPSTAFPVCGTSVFHQASVPICKTNDIFVPGCSGDEDDYANKNPYFYKFTCYVSGTLGFVITPLINNEDYDWQLYDITGHNPNDIFSNRSLVVTGNWSGSNGPTGASAAGINGIQCSSIPEDNKPTFAQMPTLIQGHEYLLMISHFSDTQSGYDLSFGGGSGSITDPIQPHMKTATTDCNGQVIHLKLNKRISCSTLSSNGSEFSISPAAATVVSAIAPACSNSFDMDSVIINLSAPLPSGNYQLVIKNGSDGNSLIDLCNNQINVGEQIAFQYFIPSPIVADSIGKINCSPDVITIFYPKKINCSSISASGTDFSVTGPTAVTVQSATGNCVNGFSDYISLKLSAPIYTMGSYLLSIQPGIDGSLVYDVCGQPILPQSFSFATADTVSAAFQYNTDLSCKENRLTFFHNGAHNVNSWNWTFNDSIHSTNPSYIITVSSTSTNTVRLIVSNSVCSDTASERLIFDNETKASFSMPPIICPEDGLVVTNTSTGPADAWKWQYDVLSINNEKNPPPFFFPAINKEVYYTVKLEVTNSILNCKDSARHSLRVLDFCYIDVPTAFTPNNDGLNDFFAPHNALKADNYEFKVFNRWGQRVFQSNNWQAKWDGKINGLLQGTGVFVWMLSYINPETKQSVFKKGTVTLIR